jgi:hypothetical protein
VFRSNFGGATRSCGAHAELQDGIKNGASGCVTPSAHEQLPTSDRMQPQFLKLHPRFTISGWRRTYGASIFSPESLAIYVDGLRKAGLPEE